MQKREATEAFREDAQKRRRLAILYSSEQWAISRLAEPPREEGQGQVVRITASAGTGKTTTLDLYAESLEAKLRTRIYYVTFSKSQAEDARRRLRSAHVTVSTVHSCAFGLLHLGEEDREDTICDEVAVEKKFASTVLRASLHF